MYVRRKLNKTGTVSVQVISKRYGKSKVIRSFGTGGIEQELVRLEEHALQSVHQNCSTDTHPDSIILFLP
jgi:hypothetical protein